MLPISTVVVIEIEKLREGFRAGGVVLYIINPQSQILQCKQNLSYLLLLIYNSRSPFGLGWTDTPALQRPISITSFSFSHLFV